MQKELNEAAEAGFRFQAFMGGETAFGGNEVVVLMQKIGSGPARFWSKLLATSKTSTMQKELQEAADAGFEFLGHRLAEACSGARRITAIRKRDKTGYPIAGKYRYELLATSKTSTLQKELQQVGAQGYQALGMTVGGTAMGGSELVVITKRSRLPKGELDHVLHKGSHLHELEPSARPLTPCAAAQLWALDRRRIVRFLSRARFKVVWGGQNDGATFKVVNARAARGRALFRGVRDLLVIGLTSSSLESACL